MPRKPEKTQAAPAGVRRFRIKRRGGLLPAVLLVLLPVVIGLMAWLVLVGVPDSALRAIEEAAAKEGIHLHIDKLRLKPAGGLAFEVDGFNLYRNKGDTEPLISLGNGMFEIRWRDVFRGSYHPKRAELNDFRANFPVTGQPDSPLPLTTKRFAIRTDSHNTVSISEGELDFGGIRLHIVGSVSIPSLLSQEETKESSLTSVEDVLALIQPGIDKIEALLDHQNWKEGEFPDIDIKPVLQQERQTYAIHINVPKLEADKFHIRGGSVNATWERDVISIHELKFKTIDPDSSFQIRGGYNLASRELEIKLRSDAPVIQMLNQALGESSPAILRKFHHEIEDAPDLDLRSNLRFDEDYHPESIFIYTTITQKRLRIGESQVNEAKLSMRYRNGSFSISDCKLTMPSGYVSLTADAEKSAARFEAEVDVAALLGLVSEFTDTPVTLPDGLVLKGQTNIKADVALTIQPFTPGQTDWRHYVPDLCGGNLVAGIEELELDGYKFKTPKATILVEGLKQDEHYLPTDMEKADITLEAGELTVPLGESQPDLRLCGAKVKAKACNIRLADLLGDTPSLDLEKADVTVSVSKLDYGEQHAAEEGEEAPALHVEKASMSWECDALKAARTEEGTDIRLQGMLTSLDIAKAGYGDFSLQEVAVKQSKAIGAWDLSQDWRTQIHTLELDVTAKELRHNEDRLGTLRVAASYEDKNPDQATLGITFTPEGTESPLVISAVPCWADPDTPEIYQLEVLNQNPSLLGPVLERFGVDLYGFQLPEQFSLQAEAGYDIPDSRLAYLNFNVNIPALTRQPADVPALVGKDATISLESKGRISTNSAGELAYSADLKITHGRDKLDAKITGDGSHLALTGENSIRPDVIDRLIDNKTAHKIIRDFKFQPDSVTKMAEIDTKISFGDPRCDLGIKATCKVDLRNFSYMLFGMEDKDGKERVRTDLGPDPFVRLHYSTCDLVVDVQNGRKGADGKPLKDICSVTLNNAVMEYDNTPWLRKFKFDNGEATSTVTGGSIIIDVGNDLVEIRDVQGRAYPAYAFGAFYSDLIGFLDIVSIPVPVELKTEGCVFPYSSSSPKPFSGTISMKNEAECQLNFLGTTIPLQNCTGFIHFEGDSVLLDRMNAGCWEGVVGAVIKFDFSGKHTSVDGYTTASCLNLRHLAAAYGSEQKDALCNARVRFAGPTLKLGTLRAYGDVSITDGELLELRIFSPVGNLLANIPTYFAEMEKSAVHAVGYTGETDYVADVLNSTGEIVGRVGGHLDTLTHTVPFANYFLSYGLNRASATFRIEKGHLLSNDLEAKGANLAIDATLDLDLDKLEIQGNLWPRIYSVPALLLTPFTFLSTYAIDIRIHGPLDDIQWELGMDKKVKNSQPSATTSPQPEQ